MEEKKKMNSLWLIPLALLGLIVWPVIAAGKIFKIAYYLLASIIVGVIVTIQQLFIFRK